MVEDVERFECDRCGAVDYREQGGALDGWEHANTRHRVICPAFAPLWREMSERHRREVEAFFEPH